MQQLLDINFTCGKFYVILKVPIMKNGGKSRRKRTILTTLT